MYENSTELRVRYAETDQMGIVYYGNYAQYFEVGRVESIRQLGLSYKQLEEMGVAMPVIEMHIKYLRPAKYDDILTIKSAIKELPVGYKIEFIQEIYSEQNKLLTSGKVLLYFVDMQTNKRTNIPEILLDKLKQYFK